MKGVYEGWYFIPFPTVLPYLHHLIRVLNSVGAAVMRQNTSQPLTMLKLQGLAPGIYWVEVLNSDGRLAYRSKLLKH